MSAVIPPTAAPTACPIAAPTEKTGAVMIGSWFSSVNIGVSGRRRWGVRGSWGREVAAFCLFGGCWARMDVSSSGWGRLFAEVLRDLCGGRMKLSGGNFILLSSTSPMGYNGGRLVKMRVAVFTHVKSLSKMTRSEFRDEEKEEWSSVIQLLMWS